MGNPLLRDRLPMRRPGTPDIARKANDMRSTNCLWRAIAAGTLSLALVGGVALPASAWAAGKDNGGKMCCSKEHWQAMRAEHEKMLSQAKAEDAQLEKMVTELNKAPEPRKTDLEAQILTKLVAQHHKMVAEWDAMHTRMAAFRKEHMQASTPTAKAPKTAQK